MNSLSIGILAPLKRPLTPTTTVSRNRIIVDLATGLSKKNHKITLFASSDSSLPNIETIPVIEKGLNFLPSSENPFYQETAYVTHAISLCLQKQTDFDLIHNHMYPEFLPQLASFQKPMVTTVHAQITPEFKVALSDTKKEGNNLVCISESAKNALGLQSTVIHNGIDTELYTASENPQRSYFLFIGRISKAKDKNGRYLDPKGVQRAIDAAKRLNVALKIVGNVEDNTFYDQLIAPNLSERIEFVQELSKEQILTREKIRDLYQNAKALLFPIQWEEPFGLVMAESMACGTPVIAYNRGSVSEILINNSTGYIVDSNSGIEGFSDAIQKLINLSQGEYEKMALSCRNHAVENFSIERMVNNYEKLYVRIIEGGKNGRNGRGPSGNPKDRSSKNPGSRKAST